MAAMGLHGAHGGDNDAREGGPNSGVHKRIGRIREDGENSEQGGHNNEPAANAKEARGDARDAPRPQKGENHHQRIECKAHETAIPRQCSDSNCASLHRMRGMQESSTEAPPKTAHLTSPRLRWEGRACCKRGDLSTIGEQVLCQLCNTLQFSYLQITTTSKAVKAILFGAQKLLYAPKGEIFCSEVALKGKACEARPPFRYTDRLESPAGRERHGPCALR